MEPFKTEGADTNETTESERVISRHYRYARYYIERESEHSSGSFTSRVDLTLEIKPYRPYISLDTWLWMYTLYYTYVNIHTYSR